jgi:hypothetical protein
MLMLVLAVLVPLTAYNVMQLFAIHAILDTLFLDSPPVRLVQPTVQYVQVMLSARAVM